jgi:hypothetical protein
MPPAQNVDSKSTSHQYTSNSRAGITNNNINTNGGSQRNVSPYLQQQLPQQQQHPSHQQQPTQQMQQHPQQQQQHSARRTPSQSTTGGTMIHAGGQSIMTSNNIQQGNVNISINKNNNNPGSLSGGGGNIRMNSSVNALPTPMFERLVTEEVQELKAYARIIENQNRRLAELERVHGDLEARLEQEARGRAQLEATLEGRERDWFLRYHELELDRNHWREEVTKEQSKNARLIDQVVRKDQDIHRMLQRKVRSSYIDTYILAHTMQGNGWTRFFWNLFLNLST